MGRLITFYPGAELKYFAIAAVLGLPASILPSSRFRGFALVWIVICSWLAAEGYQRGKEYEQWLSEKPLEKMRKHFEERAAEERSLQELGPSPPNTPVQTDRAPRGG